MLRASFVRALLGGLTWSNLLLAQGAAQSEPPAPAESALSLLWDASSGCGSAAEVRAQVVQLLGHEPRDSAPLSVQGRVEKLSDSGLRLTLRFGTAGEARERVVEAPTCDELLDAAGLVIALALQPNLRDARLPDAEEAQAPVQCPTLPPVVVVPPPSCPAAPAPPPAPAPRSVIVAPPSRHGVSLEVASPWGALPGVPSAAALGWRYSAGSWRWGLLGAWGHGEERRHYSAGATFDLGTVRLQGCWLQGEAWRLGPCLSMETGALRGHGFGVEHPARFSSLWLAAGAGGLVGFRRGDVTLSLAVTAEVPMVVPDFTLNGEALFTPWVVGVRPALALDALLW